MILRGIRDPFSIILLCKFKKFKYTRGGGGGSSRPPLPRYPRLRDCLNEKKETVSFTTILCSIISLIYILVKYFIIINTSGFKKCSFKSMNNFHDFSFLNAPSSFSGFNKYLKIKKSKEFLH